MRDIVDNELSSQRIEPGADLRQVFNWEAARWVAPLESGSVLLAGGANGSGFVTAAESYY